MSGFPGPQISKFPDFQMPPPVPAAPDELSDPNLTPPPTHPGIKYVAKSPCCDLPMPADCTLNARTGTHISIKTTPKLHLIYSPVPAFGTSV